MPTTIQRIQITAANLLEWTKVVPIEKLKQHPRNPRMGDPEMIAQSIQAHGQFRALIVSSDLYILAGNHTYQGALKEGKKELACHVLPIKHDHPQALEIMLADNRSADFSRYDDHELLSVLQEVESGAGTLQAALYDDGKSIADLLKKLSGSDDEKDDGKDKEDNYKEQYGVIVVCDGESMQEEVYNQLQEMGFSCRVVTT